MAGRVERAGAGRGGSDEGRMQLLLLLAAFAAARILRLAASAAAAADGGRSGCVFRSWAGGSCGYCSCHRWWWLRLWLGPLRLILLLAAPAAYGWRRGRPLLCGWYMLLPLRLLAADEVAASGGCGCG